MKLINHIQQALITLTTAKLRFFLAVLGILVGTATLVALISCDHLATAKALEQFKALGTNLLAVAYSLPGSWLISVAGILLCTGYLP